MRRLLLIVFGVLAALVVLVEVFVRSPTLAAILAAAGLAFADYWRRRRSFL